MAAPKKPKPKAASKPAPKVKLAKPVIDPAQQQALLATVLANPDDDQARRVYADALTAAGDPRGEFIAVQCELAARGDKTEREDPKTKPLWERFRELHSKHSSKWTKPIKALGKQTKWKWHRGFVRVLSVDGWSATATPDAVAAVLAIEPVIDLEIWGPEEAVRGVLDVPGIERVRRLGVMNLGAMVGTVPASSPRLANVRELRVGLKMPKAGLEALATSANLPAVRHLAIGMGDCSSATVEQFASSPLGKRLEIFEWCRAEVTPAMAAAFVEMPKLKTLVVSPGWSDGVVDVLRERFGDGLVVEDEPSNDYVFQGVEGVSKRTLK